MVTRKAAFFAFLIACVALPQAQATAPAGAPPPAKAGNAVFPKTVDHKYASEKPGQARLHTCLDQYHANKSGSGNGNLKWIQTGGGYYSLCSKKLKG
jgi:hypothetical protein